MVANARRFEDLPVRLLVAELPDLAAPAAAGPAAPFSLIEYAYDPATGGPPSRTPPAAPASADQATCVVVRTPAGDAFFIAGAQVERLPNIGGPLLDRAAAEAVAWRRRTLRAARQQIADERVVLLGEQLNRETTIAGIHRAIMEHAARVLGGHAVVVFERRLEPRLGGAILRALPNPRVDAHIPDLPLQPFLPLSSPGVIEPDQVRPGQPFDCLASLFEREHAAAIAYVPLGGYGIVALIERRRDRVFEPDDWFRFGAIARQAIAALDRVRLREQARSLTMTDAVTGLGTMAKLAVLAPYHIAAARRGTPLAIAVFDLPDYTRAEADADGSIHRFAETLRGQARASDVLIRAAAASFIAVLPGSAHPGARAFVSRVRDRFDQPTRLAVGTAEFDPDRPGFADLLAAARASLARAPIG